MYSHVGRARKCQLSKSMKSAYSEHMDMWLAEKVVGSHHLILLQLHCQLQGCLLILDHRLATGEKKLENLKAEVEFSDIRAAILILIQPKSGFRVLNKLHLVSTIVFASSRERVSLSTTTTSATTLSTTPE